jgi:CheY-like chemotaxis protein
MRELRKLADILDERGSLGAQKREHVRWSFCKTNVALTVDHPGGSRHALVVATRNLSRRGMSILHSAYVYENTRCEISFSSDDGEPLRVIGHVMRCNHVSGRVHEVGVQFAEEISIRDVLGLDPMLEAYSLESVDPAALHGSVLLVAGSEIEQRILVKMLESTSLDIKVANGTEDACEKAGRGCDLVLCDGMLRTGESGVDLVAALRDSGFDAPVVVIGTTADAAARDDLRMVGANGFLSKPLGTRRVLQALGEFLIADGDGGPIYTSLQGGDPLRELVDAFLRELPRLSQEIEKAMLGNDMEMALSLCRTLSGSGEPLGFAELTGLALRAEKSITETGTVRGGGADLRSLMIASRRVKHRPAG